MSLCLKVEIDAGTSQERAALELADLAGRLCVTVEASFQDVTMVARPGQAWADVLQEHERECRLQNYPES